MDEGYKYTIGGGRTCERCAAFEATVWPDPPPPLHPFCDCGCELVDMSEGQILPRECGDNRWTIVDYDTVRYGPLGHGFKWVTTVEVECWDGSTTTFVTDVDMGSDADWPGDWPATYDDMRAFQWNEVYDEAEQQAATFCTPCPDPPIIS